MAASKIPDDDKLFLHYAVWDDDIDRLQALLMAKKLGSSTTLKSITTFNILLTS